MFHALYQTLLAFSIAQRSRREYEPYEVNKNFSGEMTSVLNLDH